MSSNLSLSQQTVQKMLQKLSPQQVQVIKLLELPCLKLEQRIKFELETNPILDEDIEPKNDDMDADDDMLVGDDIPNYKYYSNNYSPDDEKYTFTVSSGVSLAEFVRQQLDYTYLTERQNLIAEYIIGSLDNDGYLRRETDFIVDDIAFSLGVEVSSDEVDEVLYMIQELDPPGVGARNLRECLLLQLEARESQSKNSEIVYKILFSYFDEYSKKHYEKIMAKLGISKADMRAAISDITNLSPRPGSLYSGGDTEFNPHIIPDFMLEYRNGKFELSLNNLRIPDIKLNSDYITMMKELAAKGNDQSESDRETVQFIRHKIDSARWFMSAVKQRHNTLMQTMQAILEYQHEYFIDGEHSRLRPMILKDIAAATGFDISTISRVVNSKYIQTHFGIYSLKTLFSEKMSTDSGEEVSSYEIKEILSKSVEEEDKKKPLTDEVLMEILNEKGYRIARRTVAKYREMLGIPVARLRKEI